MVYVCDNCGYLFSRTEGQDQCPDCGKHMIRSANPVEQGEFAARMAELIRDGCADDPRFPNLVETEICLLNCFLFKLPATALQIDSDMIVDVFVEYGESSANREELIANVWAKRSGGSTMRFLMPVRLSAQPGDTSREQVSRVFEALNNNETFKTELFDFVTDLLSHGEHALGA